MTSEPKWYCVQAKAGREVLSVLSLRQISGSTRESVGSIEVYFPKIRQMMQVAGQERELLAALFPGYFFARFNLETAGRFVASRPGVIRLVGTGGIPQVLPDSVIEELKSSAFSHESELFPAPPLFKEGQKVSFRNGPFAGMEAEFVCQCNGGKRALLLLQYLERQVNIVANLSVLESAA